MQGQKLGGSNAGKLRAVGQCLSYYGSPFIIGADWNLPPDKVADGRLHERLKANLVFPSHGTYRDPKTGNETKIDYFIASEGLAAVLAPSAEQIRRYPPVRHGNRQCTPVRPGTRRSSLVLPQY